MLAFMRTLVYPIATSDVLTYSYGMGMAFVVDAEPPKPLIGWATRVSILHPEVRCCRNDEEHKGSQTAQRASSC